MIPFSGQAGYALGAKPYDQKVKRIPTWLNSDLMKIFLVDDSVIIRQRLKRMLADEMEMQVIGEASDALGATTITNLKPDVVLLDLHLSDGSGIDVLQTLKKIQPNPAVIILTDYPYPEYRQLCLEAGADFFFVKSTEFDQVVPALKQLMRKASAGDV